MDVCGQPWISELSLRIRVFIYAWLLCPKQNTMIASTKWDIGMSYRYIANRKFFIFIFIFLNKKIVKYLHCFIMGFILF